MSFDHATRIKQIIEREASSMSFKPMLAHSKSPNPVTITYPVVVQPKLDGIRAVVVNGKLLSRTLKAIPNASIRAALERPEFNGLDGELIVGDPTAEDCYRRTTSFVMAPEKTDEPWAFHVFDKFDQPGCFWLRYGEAEKVVLSTPWTDLSLRMVPSANALNLDALEDYERWALADGYEGVILRINDAPYKFGRSGKAGPLLKLKRYVDFEAEVIDVYEEMHNANEATTNELGRTARSSHKENKIGKNTLGGLVLVALNGPAVGIEFRCGTGFDAATRAALWTEAGTKWRMQSPAGEQIKEGDMNMRAGLNGRVAKIKSFPIGVKDKPRHPVFLGWRDMEIDG